jgi:hypothetical protein
MIAIAAPFDTVSAGFGAHDRFREVGPRGPWPFALQRETDRRLFSGGGCQKLYLISWRC